MPGHSSRRQRVVELLWVGGLVLAASGMAVALTPLATTRRDFAGPGTQPSPALAPVSFPNGTGLASSHQCSSCHGYYSEEEAPHSRWVHSMMAQASRDPVFRAALAVAEGDAPNIGESCWRCHAPQGWLGGNLQATDGSTLTDLDMQGVSCSVCHRMVDPEYTPGVSPAQDQAILQALTTGPNPPGIPTEYHNGSMVVDPSDVRRGPFDLDADWVAHGYQDGFPDFHDAYPRPAYYKSAFHQSSRLCASCHDVSTAHFTKQPDGSYALNAMDQPGPAKGQQFPEQRTFSEWSRSLFAQGPVDLGGRFGGTRGAVSSCQDCHMPGIEGEGCFADPPLRPRLPQHDFNGANSWVLRAIRHEHYDSVTGMNEQGVEASIARNVAMLEKASDLELAYAGGVLVTRVINFTGHKLPTGYPEGRRMWINVQFLDDGGNLVAERGRYDGATAALTTGDTKVYEAEMGLDAAIASAVGLQPGKAFRLALNNKIFKDNRIPPMGFANASFEAVQAGHVPAGTYADGQYWDDTPFAVPAGASRAVVTVYHQTSTREYMEFLRDAGGAAGQNAYNLWVAFGMSEPVVMDQREIFLCACDWDRNGQIQVADIFAYLRAWFGGGADFDGNGQTQVADIFAFLRCWFGGC